MQKGNRKAIKIMDNFDDFLKEAAERRRNEEREGNIYLEDKTITGENGKNRRRSEQQISEEEAIEELERLCSQWTTYS